MASKAQLEKVSELEKAGWKVLPPLDPGMMGAPVPMQSPDKKTWLVHEDGHLTVSPVPEHSPP
jgi:hypothetical protein